MFEKLTFFDTEFANSKNRSICQLALICDKPVDGKVVRTERSYLVNPEDTFQYACVKIHGIMPEAVKGAPTFPELWPEIAPFFENTVVVGHNVASADLEALAGSCARYEIAMPEIRYMDTLELAQTYGSCKRFALENYRLSSLCGYYRIDVGQSHDALCDTRACAELFYILKKAAEAEPSFQEMCHCYRRSRKSSAKRYAEYHENPHTYVDPDVMPEHKGTVPFPDEILSQAVPFDGVIEGKVFCLTGDFDRMPRHDVEHFITERGGKVFVSARKSMNYLLLGTYCSRNYSTGTYGSKLAETLIFRNGGAPIAIITEADFFDALGCGCER